MPHSWVRKRSQSEVRAYSSWVCSACFRYTITEDDIIPDENIAFTHHELVSTDRLTCEELICMDLIVL